NIAWVGEVWVSAPMVVGPSTKLRITGSNGAAIIGRGVDQLFHVQVGAALHLSHLTLKHGYSRDNGGCIHAPVFTMVEAEDCAFEGCAAEEMEGGAIYSAAGSE
ncbi:unnamed protein product, partial [Chrysoparadoxa australica]